MAHFFVILFPFSSLICFGERDTKEKRRGMKGNGGFFSFNFHNFSLRFEWSINTFPCFAHIGAREEREMRFLKLKFLLLLKQHTYSILNRNLRGLAPRASSELFACRVRFSQERRSGRIEEEGVSPMSTAHAGLIRATSLQDRDGEIWVRES